MFQQNGDFGFINDDLLSPPPLILYDFGMEHRENEVYDFTNDNRENYSGYLFQYTLDGSGIFESPAGRISLEKNQGFFISLPHSSRYFLPTKKNAHWHFLFLHFDGSVASPFYQEITRINGNILELPKNSRTIQLFLEEYHSIYHGKKYRRYEAGAFLYRFLSSLLNETERPCPTKQTIAAIGHQWIERNYTSHHSLSEMCQEIGISLPYFSREFRKQYGTGAMEYLTRMRLEHSLQLLLNTDLSINEIALCCGFSNANYYAKVFRKTMAVSPSAYRSQHGFPSSFIF